MITHIVNLPQNMPCSGAQRASVTYETRCQCLCALLTMCCFMALLLGWTLTHSAQQLLLDHGYTYYYHYMSGAELHVPFVRFYILNCICNSQPSVFHVLLLMQCTTVARCVSVAGPLPGAAAWLSGCHILGLPHCLVDGGTHEYMMDVSLGRACHWNGSVHHTSSIVAHVTWPRVPCLHVTITVNVQAWCAYNPAKTTPLRHTPSIIWASFPRAYLCHGLAVQVCLSILNDDPELGGQWAPSLTIKQVHGSCACGGCMGQLRGCSEQSMNSTYNYIDNTL